MKRSIDASELNRLIQEATEETIKDQNNLAGTGLDEMYTPIIQLSTVATLKILEKLDIIEIK